MRRLRDHRPLSPTPGRPNLQVQVSSLRKALGPSAIATIPGRGYRLTLPLGAPARAARPSDASTGGGGPALAQDAPRTNLPATTPLIGRDDDLDEATDLMRRCPVVTIVGAGGIGKTRLALALATVDPLEARDGRWWVELASINDAAQVPAAGAGASVDDWLKAGERLSQAQVAALAFEGGRVEEFLG